MSLPKCSWITCTYNRAPDYLHLVEEAVESFRQNAAQYDGESEMILLSDAPGQTLVCDVPGVRVINHPTRFPSLGEKLNYAIDQSTGTVIIPQDDDDISLPNRAAQMVDDLGDWVYLKYIGYFFQDPRGLHTTHHMGVCHNSSVFLKEAWERAGKYPHISGAQDAALDTALCEDVYVQRGLTREPNLWVYVYRWGIQPVHLSGVMPHDDFYRHVGTLPVTLGTFKIQARWQQDYVALCRAACARHPAR